MKKLRLRDLQALAHELLPVNRLEQRSLMGGGTGSNLDPFSQEEYRTMLAQGTWEGGFVAGDVQDPTSVSMQYIPSSSSSGEEELLSGQNVMTARIIANCLRDIGTAPVS